MEMRNRISPLTATTQESPLFQVHALLRSFLSLACNSAHQDKGTRTQDECSSFCHFCVDFFFLVFVYCALEGALSRYFIEPFSGFGICLLCGTVNFQPAKEYQKLKQELHTFSLQIGLLYGWIRITGKPCFPVRLQWTGFSCFFASSSCCTVLAPQLRSGLSWSSHPETGNRKQLSQHHQITYKTKYITEVRRPKRFTLRGKKVQLISTQNSFFTSQP